MEYVTVKVPRKALPIIHELQAEETLEEGRKVSQAEVILEALEEKKAKKTHASKKKTYSFWDIYGSIKGGKKTNSSKDIDNVVYGPMESP